jgi:hypothetical protein
MKGRWSLADYELLATGDLVFSPEDVNRLQAEASREYSADAYYSMTFRSG